MHKKVQKILSQILCFCCTEPIDDNEGHIVFFMFLSDDFMDGRILQNISLRKPF